MTQYIDKAKVVDEIKRRIKEHHSGYRVALKDILSFLDTLDVKEVDLGKDIEYTRADAFIKKTEEFLYKMLNDGRMECGDIQKLIDEFKKYNED